jgi:hypothetical protein
MDSEFENLKKTSLNKSDENGNLSIRNFQQYEKNSDSYLWRKRLRFGQATKYIQHHNKGFISSCYYYQHHTTQHDNEYSIVTVVCVWVIYSLSSFSTHIIINIVDESWFKNNRERECVISIYSSFHCVESEWVWCFTLTHIHSIQLICVSTFLL